MYRKLWLKNNKGDTFTFTEKNSKVFLNNPNGFGFGKTLTTYNLGNVSKVIGKEINFQTIDGSLLFYNKREQAYQDYFNFVKFISYEPIRLYYLPPNTLNPYYCDCEIINAQKGEYSLSGYLEIPLSIQMTSHWQDAEETIKEYDNTSVGEGKYYDLERPYYYNASNLDDIVLDNNGNDEVGIIVEIIGEVSNPQWTISQNDEVYGSAKINGTYDYVKVNSRDGEQEIYLERNGSAIVNPASYQDLSISGGVLTFIKLKTGQSKLNFTSGNISTFSGKVRIHLKNSYISV